MTHYQNLVDAAYEIALDLEAEHIAIGGQPWADEKLEHVAMASLQSHLEDIGADQE